MNAKETRNAKQLTCRSVSEIPQRHQVYALLLVVMATLGLGQGCVNISTRAVPGRGYRQRCPGVALPPAAQPVKVCVGFCTSPLGLGATCTLDECAPNASVCTDNLVCQGNPATPGQGTCQPPQVGSVINGTNGSPFNECDPLLDIATQGTGCPGTGVCARLRQPGNPQDTGSYCGNAYQVALNDNTLHWVRGLCREPRVDGQSCDSDLTNARLDAPGQPHCATCAPGLLCLDGSCKRLCNNLDGNSRLSECRPNNETAPSSAQFQCAPQTIQPLNPLQPPITTPPICTTCLGPNGGVQNQANFQETTRCDVAVADAPQMGQRPLTGSQFVPPTVCGREGASSSTTQIGTLFDFAVADGQRPLPAGTPLCCTGTGQVAQQQARGFARVCLSDQIDGSSRCCRPAGALCVNSDQCCGRSFTTTAEGCQATQVTRGICCGDPTLDIVARSLCEQALTDQGRPTPFLNNSCYLPRCGQPGEPCCHAATANVCNPMTVCRGDRPLDTCLPCGAEQQPCCSDHTCPRGTVSQRLECNRAGSNETCVPCGGAGQPCCTSGTACAANSQCVSSNVGLPTCQPCGQPGQACCNGTTCVAGVTCTGPGAARVCQPPNCANGGTCPPNTVCVGTTCQPCGTAGIQCCPGSTCTGANFLRCDASNVCQPCGAQNGTCCGSMPYCQSASDVCSPIGNGDAFVCRPCGVLEGSPCCPGANGGASTCINQSLYCNGALNRCERCGTANAQCCAVGEPCPDTLGHPPCDPGSNRCVP